MQNNKGQVTDILQFYKGEVNNYVKNAKVTFITSVNDFLRNSSWFKAVKGKIVKSELNSSNAPHFGAEESDRSVVDELERMKRIEKIRNKNKRLAGVSRDQEAISFGSSSKGGSNLNFNPVFESSPHKAPSVNSPRMDEQPPAFSGYTIWEKKDEDKPPKQKKPKAKTEKVVKKKTFLKRKKDIYDP